MKTAEQRVSRARADHRDRRVGAAARAAVGARAARPRRLDLRDLRRVLLPRQADRRRRRRRLGDGGSDLPHALRLARDGHPSPRHAARVEDHAGQGVRQPEDLVRVEHRGRATSTTRARAKSPAMRAARTASPASGRNIAVGRRVRRDRPHAEHVALQRPARDGRERLPHHARRAHAPACPASSRAATSRITSTARRSPPPGQAAWRRSTPSDTSSTTALGAVRHRSSENRNRDGDRGCYGVSTSRLPTPRSVDPAAAEHHVAVVEHDRLSRRRRRSAARRR